MNVAGVVSARVPALKTRKSLVLAAGRCATCSPLRSRRGWWCSARWPPGKPPARGAGRGPGRGRHLRLLARIHVQPPPLVSRPTPCGQRDEVITMAAGFIGVSWLAWAGVAAVASALFTVIQIPKQTPTPRA